MIHLINKEDEGKYIWRPKNSPTIKQAIFNIDTMNWTIEFKPHCDPFVSAEEDVILNRYYFKFKRIKGYDYKALANHFIDHIIESYGWVDAVHVLLGLDLSKEDLATLFGFDIDDLNRHFPCGEDD